MVKVGDIVKITDRSDCCRDEREFGHERRVLCVYNTGAIQVYCEGNSGVTCDFSVGKFKIVKKYMNIIEKFKIALLQEPEKSFREKGIIYGDGMLTEDGKVLFLQYLLEEKKEAFKTAVVDKIVEDKE